MDNQSQVDPFDQLFVDREALDRQLLADLILPYVRLQRNTTEVIMTEEGDELTLAKRVLVYLLARKVLVATGVTEEEGAAPAQIEKDTGIPGGSLRPTLSRLVDDKLIRADKAATKTAYFVPNHAVRQIAKLFKSEDK